MNGESLWGRVGEQRTCQHTAEIPIISKTSRINRRIRQIEQDRDTQRATPRYVTSA